MDSNRALTAIAVMAATIMQVLDTTITNVALPNMAGELDATPDNISWVLTSYLIGSAIIMPLTGCCTCSPASSAARPWRSGRWA